MVSACIKRMRLVHPEWEVIVLNSIEESCPGLERLSVQHRSDWARICALAEHGGVWLDATCVCVKPVTEWVDMQSTTVQGFTAPFDPTNQCLENWALAAPPKHPLVLAWKAEFRRAIGLGFDRYKEEMRDVLGAHIIYNQMPYLTQHACYVAVKDAFPPARTIPAVDGPFRFHRRFWKLKKSKGWRALSPVDDITALVLMLAWKMPDDTPALVKMRGPERDRCPPVAVNGSFAHVYLGRRGVSRERYVLFPLVLVSVVIALFVLVIRSRRGMGRTHPAFD